MNLHVDEFVLSVPPLSRAFSCFFTCLSVLFCDLPTVYSASHLSLLPLNSWWSRSSETSWEMRTGREGTRETEIGQSSCCWGRHNGSTLGSEGGMLRNSASLSRWHWSAVRYSPGILNGSLKVMTNAHICLATSSLNMRASRCFDLCNGCRSGPGALSVRRW